MFFFFFRDLTQVALESYVVFVILVNIKIYDGYLYTCGSNFFFYYQFTFILFCICVTYTTFDVFRLIFLVTRFIYSSV